MKVKTIKLMAQGMGLKVSKLNKKDMIQLIQKEEGNYSCYSTPAIVACVQNNCLWREDCLKSVN